MSNTWPTKRSGRDVARSDADGAGALGHIAVHADAGQPDREHHGGLIAFLGGKVGGRLGRTQRLQRDVDHDRMQKEPPRPLFGRCRQPHRGTGRTGARDGEADDALEGRPVLLAGASQPPIQFLRIELGRRGVVDVGGGSGGDCGPRSRVALAWVVHPDVVLRERISTRGFDSSPLSVVTTTVASAMCIT